MSRCRRKGWRAALIAAAAMWTLGQWIPAQGAIPVRVFIDDLPLTLGPAAVVQNDFLYLPLRLLAQHFQASLKFDSPIVEVRRADGVAFTLRLGRLEIWSDGVVVAVAEAPVLLVNGFTLIPAGALDVLFDTLTVWNRQENTVVIVTHSQTFQAAVTSKPLPAPSRTDPTQALAHAFVPEFQPDHEPPMVGQGYVTVGLSVGAGNGVTAMSRLQYQTLTGPDRIDGTMAMAAGPGSFQTAGTVTVRRPTSTLTIGGLSINESPLTLYEQGLVGVMYQGSFGPYGTRFYGGGIPNSNSQAYGLSVQLPAIGPWLLQTGLLYDPVTGAVIAKGRVDRSLRSGLSMFGEFAGGVSTAGSGTAWRAGLTTSISTLTASLSYVSLSSGFPTVGNASLFAGRSGPLLQLSYRPTPQWSFLASAAALKGGSSAFPDRVTYSLLTGYWPSPNLGFVAELGSVEDTSLGLHTRSTTAQAAMSFTSGRWGVVLATSHTADTDLLAGTTSGTSTLGLRAGYALRDGLPVWAELTRSTGTTEAWGYGLGWSFRLSPRMDLTTQLRHTVYTIPSAYSESSLEVGVTRPLSTGAQITLGAGLRYNSSAGSTAPYLAIQYGYPVYVHGDLRVGRLSGVLYVDANGNGRRDPGESGVAGVMVRIDGRSAAVSNDAGTAAVDGVLEGEYRISIDEDTIPAGLLPLQATQQTVRITNSETTQVEFALVPAASLRGVVFFDENGNGIRDQGEKTVFGVVITLQPGGRLRASELDGTFEFQYLTPGEYVLTVDSSLLPQGLRVRENGAYAVTLRPGGAAVVDIPLLNGKGVVKTFP